MKDLLESVNSESIKNFQSFKTNEERFEAALSLVSTDDSLPEVGYDVKDAKESVNLKNKGNQLFVSRKGDTKKLLEAWNLYTKSIAVAPPLSKELAIAYANRSAVLKDLEKYKECMEDIDRALNTRMNYPNHLKGKLLVRKAECLKYLKDTEVEDSIGNELKRWFEDMSLSRTEEKSYEEKLHDISKSNNLPPTSSAKSKIKKSPILAHPHKNIPCASDAVSLQHNEKFGKHLVANRKIRVGEILILEKPFATVLLPEEIYTHCAHCLQHAWAGIPCEYCTHAIYCSEQCKNEAWTKYHDVECTVMSYFTNANDQKHISLSLRITTLAIKQAGSVEKLRDSVEKINDCKDTLKKHFSKDGVFHSEKYETIYPLETHAEKIPANRHLVHALHSVFLSYFLYTKTNFFEKPPDFNLKTMSKNKNAIFIGSLILRHMQMASINAYCHYEYNNIFDLEPVGASIAGFFSFLNHSCHPNASLCTSREGIIIYAANPIEKGSQIYFNYGFYCDDMDSETRRKTIMEHYYFKCECTMCIQNDMVLKLQRSKVLDRNTLDDCEDIKLCEQWRFYNTSLLEGTLKDNEKVMVEMSKLIEVMGKRLPLFYDEIISAIGVLGRLFFAEYGIKHTYKSII